MNIEPVFVNISDVFDIHEYQIQRFGGSDGLRSIELLESAIAMPSATFDGQYLYPTILDMLPLTSIIWSKIIRSWTETNVLERWWPFISSH